MIRALAIGLALAACSKSSSTATGAQPAGPINATIKSLADRACACNADKECVRPIRDEWDGEKRALLDASAGFTGADKAAFDDALTRLRGCGDGAGLTIWLQ